MIRNAIPWLICLAFSGCWTPAHANDLDTIKSRAALGTLSSDYRVPVQAPGESFARQLSFDKATRDVLQNAPVCRRMRVGDYGLPTTCWDEATDTGVDWGTEECPFRDVWAARLHGTATNADACTACDTATNADFATLAGSATNADNLTLDPAACGANTFVTDVDRQVDLTCSAITDAAVPNNITIDVATAANSCLGTASAGDPSSYVMLSDSTPGSNRPCMTSNNLQFDDTAPGTLTTGTCDCEVDWSNIDSTPTTLAGYGISDAAGMLTQLLTVDGPSSGIYAQDAALADVAEAVEVSSVSDSATYLTFVRTLPDGTSRTLHADGNLSYNTVSGNLSATSFNNGTLSGNNSGDVTLAGTPDYITISGQVITRSKLDPVDDLNTFASSVLRGLLTDENGTGAALFDSATSPTFLGTIDGVNLDLSGKMVAYNGATTVARGVPSAVYEYHQTGLGAAVGSTTILASAPATGFYRVSVYAEVTTVGTVSSTLGPFSLFWTPPGSSTASSANIILQAFNLAPVTSTTATGNLVSTNLFGDTVVYIKTGTAFTWTMGYASNAAGTMKYALDIVVEAI